MGMPVNTRLRFLSNGIEISDLTLERGQVELIELITEVQNGEDWIETNVATNARIIAVGEEGFIEVSSCEVTENLIRIFADLPPGSYYLEVRAEFQAPVELVRIRRMKVKVVIDRK